MNTETKFSDHFEISGFKIGFYERNGSRPISKKPGRLQREGVLQGLHPVFCSG